MKRKQFYLVDLNEMYQVLIFRVHNYDDDDSPDDDTYDFYLSDGYQMIYQFGLRCCDCRVSEFENIALSNFLSGNMRF